MSKSGEPILNRSAIREVLPDTAGYLRPKSVGPKIRLWDGSRVIKLRRQSRSRVLIEGSGEITQMPKLASILACCVVVSMFSVETQALPVSPVPAQGATSQVILVRGSCGRGYHHRHYDGACVPYVGPQAFGLPYVELPSVRLPYVDPPAVGLRYVELPAVRLPYVEPPAARLPYVEPPAVRLPYAELPLVRLPYIEPPAVRLPYAELPVVGLPHVCPNGYSYYPAYRRCVPI
jgi:hypothetical protein